MTHRGPDPHVPSEDPASGPRSDGPVPVAPWPAGPTVRALMITSLDGAAAGPDGLSGSLGGPADRALLSDTRASADVILVGRATAVAEAYRAVRLPTPDRRSRGQEPRARLAIVTGAGLDRGMPAFADPEAPPLVVTSARGARAMPWLAASEVLVAGEDDVDLPSVVARLGGVGLGRIVCEGGPSLLGALLRADSIDEIALTLAPLTVGGGPGLVRGPLPTVRWALAAHPVHEGYLFLHYRRHG